MKKVLIGFLVVLAVAVGGALVAPSFIDWSSYRGEIAGEIRKATGRAFAIDGPIDVALLPAPKLSVRKARLANLEGAREPEMVRLDALDLRIAFWPLLSGKVVVQSVVLRGADIRLEKLADGRENWDFSKPGAKAGAASPMDGIGGGAPVGPARGAGDAISLEQVSIENSGLSYRDSRTGKVQRVQGINARIAAGTLSGPFAARGVLRYGGLPLSFELRAGRISEGASTKVSLEAGFPEAKAKASYSGYVTPGKPSVTFTGQISASGPDLGALMATLARAAETGSAKDRKAKDQKAKPGPSAGPAQPFTLAASLTGGSESLALKDIVAEMNGTKATGALAIQPAAVTQIDGDLKITQLDLDKWMGTGGAGPGAGKGPAKTGAQPAKAGFVLPGDVNLSLRAAIGNVVYRKGLIRDLNATVSMEKGTLGIRSLDARLPGSTQAALSGSLTAKKGEPRFEGKVQLDSGDFRALVRWLTGEDLPLPRDRLRKARFAARVGSLPDRIELRDMDFTFDSSRLKGGMVLALRERIGMGASLTLDHLNVDAYLPKPEKPGKGAGNDGAKAKAPAPAGAGLAALGGFDANFNLAVGGLTYGGERITGLRMEGALVAGTLTLKKLHAASLAGARLDAEGTVRGINKTPVPDLTLSLEAKDPRRLLALAGLPLPVPADRLGPLTVKGRVKQDGNAVTTDLALTAGKIDIAAKGRIQGLDQVPSVDLDLSLGHPDFVTFVRLLDPEFRPERPAKGPIRLAAKVTSSGLDLKFEKLEAQLGEARLAGAASLSLASLPPLLKGNLQGEEIVLDHFLSGPETPAAAPQTTKSGAKTGAKAGAKPGGGGGAGGAPWTDDPIDVGMLRLLDADLQVRAKAIAWRRWRVVEPRLDVTLEKGKLAMRRLTGGMLGGSFHMTGGLAAPDQAGGPVDARFDVDVARMDLKQAMFNAADIDVVKGKVDFKMALTGRGPSSRSLAKSLAGSGSLRASDGAVSGFDLKRANDRLKNLKDGLSLLTLLQAAMAGGSTTFSKLSGTFDVKNGVLRSNDVEIDADGGSGKGTLEADLGRWLMDGRMQFRLAGNAKAPSFGLQLKGPLDNPRRIIQANELQAWLAERAAGALINQFMGRPKQPQDTQQPDQQPRPSARDQFIQGIFDVLKKK